MEASNTPKIGNEHDKGGDVPDRLGLLFGGYRAEWLKEHIFELFTEPSYFPELKGLRPCVLEGGRGTGKTTVLRCLSYEGQFALSGADPSSVASWPFFGFYHRINTNRVTAFQGPERDEQGWTRLFAHYCNLEMVHDVIVFLRWFFQQVPLAPDLSPDSYGAVAASLHLPGASDRSVLEDQILAARRSFESHINNIGDPRVSVPLSMQAVPVDELLAALSTLPQFKGKHFFFLLDEYENLLDYQQRVLNTLIKHSGTSYTFKIGVRELGLRARSTLNDNEQLISPSDYVRINISEKLGERFADFASRVCNARLTRLSPTLGTHDFQVASIFGTLSDEDEATLLEIEPRLSALRKGLSDEVSPIELEHYDKLSNLSAYLIFFWAESNRQKPSEVLRWALKNSIEWDHRISNYSHALLYTLRRGKRGVRKYYAGWDVITRLAGRNIRYLLELVDQALLLHLKEGHELGERIPFKTQTEAAQAVGKKNLTELEGVSVQGVRLTRLLLALGRVFQVLASEPEGHTPEVTQFSLSQSAQNALSASREADVEELLKSAVMHLALIRFPGNKLQDASDTKAYDYMIHPIFSAFFEFNYRRKRKLILQPAELLGLVEDPRGAITGILSRQKRETSDPLPDQLRLFENFYAADL